MPAARPELGVDIRPAAPGDINYVLDSWRRAAISALRRVAESIPNQHMHAAQRALIGSILQRPGLRVMVATPAVGQTSDIAGYIVSEPKAHTLHWLSTKLPYRRARVATRLMVDVFGPVNQWPDTIRCSHWTAAAGHRQREGWPLQYTPGVLAL